MDMMLNSLPSRTWNRLGMNESFIKIEEQLKNHIPEAAFEENSVSWEPNAQGDFSWADHLNIGMGKDICTLMEQVPACLIQSEIDTQMASPIVLKFDYDAEEASASRILIHARKGSSVSVILLMQSKDPASKGLSVIQTSILAEEGSSVHIYAAQLLGAGFDCLNDIEGICEDHASIELTKLELGGGHVYAGTGIDLKGRESAFTTDVGYHVHEDQTLDMNYVAAHHGPKSNSYMEVSGTLEEGSRKIFRGTIDFQRGCPGAKGTETENVLLMGRKMVNQSIPLILCKEEDVEGNHGASIGQLDEKILFYLSSRGISPEAAQKIIAQSRIDAICSKIPDEDVRTIIHNFER